MAFKVLLRAIPGELTKTLETIFDEQPIELRLSDATDVNNASDFSSTLEAMSPSIIVNVPNLLADAKTDEAIHQSIVDYCKANETPLIHCSSYRVFGEQQGSEAVVEDEEVNPQGEISERLYRLESISASLAHHIILRHSWVLGAGVSGDNYENALGSIISKLVENQTFVLSDHNYGNPVNTAFIANVISAMCQQILCGSENWGVFHVHGSDKCSEAEFGDALVRLVSSELGRDVTMPEVATVGNEQRIFKGNALLAGRRCTDNFGIQLPSWRKGLKGMVSRYLDAKGYRKNEAEVSN